MKSKMFYGSIFLFAVLLLTAYTFFMAPTHPVNGTDNGELTLYKGEVEEGHGATLIYGGIEERTGGGQQPFLNVWYDNFRGVGGAGRIYIDTGDKIMIDGILYEVTGITDSYASFRRYP